MNYQRQIPAIEPLQPLWNPIGWEAAAGEEPTMTKALAYARVSSREQEREGYSIPAQRKLLAEYARARGLQIEREFIDIESAKNPGRKEFGQMLHLLEIWHPLPCGPRRENRPFVP